MWAKAAASAVVGYGFGTLIALALLLGEGGPDLTLVGPGFVRALAAIGAAAVLVGVAAGWVFRSGCLHSELSGGCPRRPAGGVLLELAGGERCVTVDRVVVVAERLGDQGCGRFPHERS